MSKRVGLILSVLLWVHVSAAAQTSDLFSRVERTIKAKEPSWNIERVLPGQTKDPLTESIVLRQERSQATIDIWIWKTAADAHDMFSAQVIAKDNTRGTKALKRNIRNLGDENYMWTNAHSETWTTIDFRSGNIWVSVFAPTASVAERFAHYVLDQVSPTQ